MKQPIQPNLDKIERLIAARPNGALKQIPLLKVGEIDRPTLLNAVPYYILAYSKNLRLLTPYVKQPALRIILSGLAKALELAAKYYRIETKDII